jgi:hypothetical protein
MLSSLLPNKRMLATQRGIQVALQGSLTLWQKDARGSYWGRKLPFLGPTTFLTCENKTNKLSLLGERISSHLRKILSITLMRLLQFAVQE